MSATKLALPLLRGSAAARVLAHLVAHPKAHNIDVATALGVPLGTASGSVAALVAVGLVEGREATAKGREALKDQRDERLRSTKTSKRPRAESAAAPSPRVPATPPRAAASGLVAERIEPVTFDALLSEARVRRLVVVRVREAIAALDRGSRVAVLVEVLTDEADSAARADLAAARPARPEPTRSPRVRPSPRPRAKPPVEASADENETLDDEPESERVEADDEDLDAPEPSRDDDDAGEVDDASESFARGLVARALGDEKARLAERAAPADPLASPKPGPMPTVGFAVEAKGGEVLATYADFPDAMRGFKRQRDAWLVRSLASKSVMATKAPPPKWEGRPIP